ncbi:MAG: STAS domain-containing protein [Cyclobacteriaceae bacterium]|nr:STAS domain-containing protein [Cyclobacteriaceae bacterium]MCH8516827.1 STAS domain-containing protein [Cyclobacteriaceae bacterium]
MNSFSIEQDDRYHLLKINGDLLGEENGTAILEQVSAKLGEEKFFLVVDIENMRYINSAGLGVLITLLTKIRNKGGDICLFKATDQVKKVLMITKLDKIFGICASKEEAVANVLGQE